MPDKPKILGILNVTPDSFSDGGVFSTPPLATKHAIQLLEQGADYVDIGAESTRPGSRTIDSKEEWQRLEPVLQDIVKEIPPSRLSIDTRHGYTVRKACELGVGMINNVFGLFERDTLTYLSKFPDIKYCIMHMHSTPLDMQKRPLGADEILEIVDLYFKETADYLTKLNFSFERLVFDPGIGFGKTDPANFALLKHAETWTKQYQMLYGVSRKSFIGRKWNIEDPKDRDGQSKLLESELIEKGVQFIRTHQVEELVNFLH